MTGALNSSGWSFQFMVVTFGGNRLHGSSPNFHAVSKDTVLCFLRYLSSRPFRLQLMQPTFCRETNKLVANQSSETKFVSHGSQLRWYQVEDAFTVMLTGIKYISTYRNNCSVSEFYLY